MFSLAHISDPHLAVPAALAGASPHLSLKRLSCLLSWRLKKRFIHRPEVLTALLADVKSVMPDHLVVTGDLINLSLPREFAAAEAWLSSLGGPEDVTVVPGNHDRLADDVAWQDGLGRWSAYIRGDGEVVGAAFPSVRRRGPVALVGLSSAVPTPLFRAGGSLGREQIDAAEERLRALGKEGLCRVVLMHHPPIAAGRGLHTRKMLRDHPDLRAAVARAGAELVLHGHSHCFGLSRIELENGGFAPALSVPSGSAFREDSAAAGWNLYRIDRDGGGGWRIEVEARGRTPTGAFVRRGRFSLVLGRGP